MIWHFLMRLLCKTDAMANAVDKPTGFARKPAAYLHQLTCALPKTAGRAKTKLPELGAVETGE